MMKKIEWGYHAHFFPTFPFILIEQHINQKNKVNEYRHFMLDSNVDQVVS